MEISWEKQILHEQYHIDLPKKVEFTFGEKTATLIKERHSRCVALLRGDFRIDGPLFIHHLGGLDSSISFHCIIDPANKRLFVPPGAIQRDQRYTGSGGLVQRVLEKIAARNGLTLIVCIAASQITGFSDRVTQILGREGYYLGTPIEEGTKTRAYGIHQSSYTGNGIPELGIEPGDLLPPRIHNG